MNDSNKNSKVALFVAAGLILALLTCFILLGIRLAGHGRNFMEQLSRLQEQQLVRREEDKNTIEETATVIPELTKEPETEEPGPDTPVEVSKVNFVVQQYLGDVYIIERYGRYGMADLDGNILVEAIYDDYTYCDEDWVSFSFRGMDSYECIFDHTGKKLYQYEFILDGFITEDGTPYHKQVYYRKGMRIEQCVTEDNYYYGVSYYNAETGELIFERIGDWYTLNVATLADDTGVAAAIVGEGFESTLYLITKDGYTEETYTEPLVERRHFYYSDHISPNLQNQHEGWMYAGVEELRGELLSYSTEYREVLYNIKTKEIVPLPEKYQNGGGRFFLYSKGLYYGISGESFQDFKEDRTDCVYYAVCHGTKVLTEELYMWMDFGEKYIIAGNDDFSHILDYEGNVLAEYKDVSYPFVDGRTLVTDETGCFFIDEALNPCSGYIMENVDYCFPGYIRKINNNYLVKWIGKEEE